MPANQPIKIGPLKQGEIGEADRIFRLAFGTFLGMPNPLDFLGDRKFVAPRWHSSHIKVIAAREGNRLVGSNLATRWGSFGFFGPLTVFIRRVLERVRIRGWRKDLLHQVRRRPWWRGRG